MILIPDLRTVFVHFDAPDEYAFGTPHRAVSSHPSECLLARMRWYIEWTAGTDRNAYVFLSHQLGSVGDGLAAALQPGHLVRYRDEADVSVSLPRRRGYVFIVNGRQFPIIRWQQAISAARREGADVLAFGPVETATRTHYAESVLVDTEGSVVRFKRHYCDSPMFADRWSGEASFLVVRSEHFQPVAAHIVVRGWGLESIGSLVRRFAVRWSDDPEVVADDGIHSDDVLGLSPPVQPAAATPASNDGNGARAVANVQKNRFANGKTRDFRGEIDRAGKNDSRCPDPSTTMTSTESGAEIAWSLTSDQAADAPWASWTDDLPDIKSDRAYLFAKRTLDLTASALGLIVLSPLLFIVAILVKLTSPGPVLFAHIRQGLGGREFPCLKFRSMRTGADAMQAELKAMNEVDGPQFKITDDPRLTPIGLWLRRWNIDELPQLLNVLVGQMSLVGPRPSPDRENQYCPPWRRARLSTKPGITGLWQVLRLRDEASSDFQEWIYYDVEYACHRSFWLDLNILFYTFPAIFGSRRVKAFARRLKRSGICAHSPIIARDRS